jgi:hypothetical protein
MIPKILNKAAYLREVVTSVIDYTREQFLACFPSVTREMACRVGGGV